MRKKPFFYEEMQRKKAKRMSSSTRPSQKSAKMRSMTSPPAAIALHRRTMHLQHASRISPAL
jgi:hypothetical protein